MVNLMPFLRSILPHPERRLRDMASEASWECDPLAHPALQRMSPDELADLPFEREQCPVPPLADRNSIPISG